MGLFESIFGGNPSSPQSYAEDLGQDFKYGQPYGPRGGPFASGSATTPTGAGPSSGYTRNLDMSGRPQALAKVQNMLGKGKFKNLTEEQREQLAAGGAIDWTQLTKGAKKKLKKAGYKRPQWKPYTENTPDPSSAEDFGFLQDMHGQWLQEQNNFRDQYLKPLANMLGGFQQQAVGEASRYMDEGFTSNSPYQQQRNEDAYKAYYDRRKNQLDRERDDALMAVNEMMANSGTPMNWSSASQDFVREGVMEPFSQRYSDLGHQAEEYARSLFDMDLNNQRQAFVTSSGAPTFNASMSGLNVPYIGYDPTMIQPGGQFDYNMLNNQQQYQNTLGYNYDTNRQNLGLNLTGIGAQFAQQPTAGQQIGQFAGTMIPPAMAMYSAYNNPVAKAFANSMNR